MENKTHTNNTAENSFWLKTKNKLVNQNKVENDRFTRDDKSKRNK